MFRVQWPDMHWPFIYMLFKSQINKFYKRINVLSGFDIGINSLYSMHRINDTTKSTIERRNMRERRRERLHSVRFQGGPKLLLATHLICWPHFGWANAIDAWKMHLSSSQTLIIHSWNSINFEANDYNHFQFRFNMSFHSDENNFIIPHFEFDPIDVEN